MNSVKFQINHAEQAPDEFRLQLPFSAKIIRQIPGNDRIDYFLAKLEKTLVWTSPKDGSTKEIRNIVVCTRYKGQQLNPKMSNMGVAVAYVIDSSLMNDPILRFSKIKYMAKARATAISSKLRKVFS